MNILRSLHLKFPKVELEQDYKALKEENVVRDFKMCVRFLFLLNVVVFIFNAIDKSWIEASVAGGTAITMILLYSIHRYLIKHIQLVTLAMIIVYNISRLVLVEIYFQRSSKARLFYAGYGLASVQCILFLRLPKISHKIYGMIAALVLRFVFVSAYVEPGSFVTSSFVRHFLIDAFIIYTVYTYEIIFRKVYQNFVQKKEELLKFKEFLAESLPQSLIVLTDVSKDPLFSNKAFQNTFCSCDTSSSSSPILTKEYLKTNLKSLHVDLATLRETGRTQSCLTLFNDRESAPLEEVLEKLSEEDYLESKTISLAASFMQEGHKRLFEVTIKKVKWDSEDALAILFNDITYQESLMALKMSNINKDKVIATVSHELRTPSNGIIGILDIAEKKVNDDEVSEYVSLCKDNAHLLLSLVNSILDLQQISAGKLKLNPIYIEIRRVITSITKLFSFQCRQKSISLDYEVAMSVPVYICTDENRLKQVLINLVGNAIKFTSKGGVKIEVISHPQSPDCIQISVTDTGIGIRQEDQGRLFKMYSKIEDGESVNKNGVGLGLTISSALASLLACESKGIQVKSDYGTGSTFFFDIQRNLRESKVAQVKKINTNSSEKKMVSEHPDESGNETTRGILAQQTVLDDGRRTEDEIEFECDQNKDCEEFFNSGGLKFRITSSDSLRRINTPTNFLSSAFKNSFNSRMCSGITLSPLEDQQKFVKSLKDIEISNLTADTARFGPEAHILIVDDNPFNLLVAKSLIQEFVPNIKTALSGQEALEIVTKSSSEGVVFKLVFMDCQMPIMDGFETTKALKALMDKDVIPAIPIYGWTANNSEEDVKRCFEAGMVGHLPKPATKLDILKVLTEL